jgi:hypothetical protein
VIHNRGHPWGIPSGTTLWDTPRASVGEPTWGYPLRKTLETLLGDPIGRTPEGSIRGGPPLCTLLLEPTRQNMLGGPPWGTVSQQPCGNALVGPPTGDRPRRKRLGEPLGGPHSEYPTGGTRLMLPIEHDTREKNFGGHTLDAPPMGTPLGDLPRVTTPGDPFGEEFWGTPTGRTLWRRPWGFRWRKPVGQH